MGECDLVYVGVGSRSTPIAICMQMTGYARRLQRLGFILRSGAADRADIAFELGAGHAKEIYLPFNGFAPRVGATKRYTNGSTVRVLTEPIEARAITLASFIHEAWGAVLCSRSARFAVAAHARNCAQVLGADLNAPAAFLVCWAPIQGASVAGGTRTAYELARHQGIPTFNLAVDAEGQRFERFLDALENEGTNQLTRLLGSNGDLQGS